MISSIDKIKALFAIILSAAIIGFSYIFVKNGLKWSSPLDLLADRLAIAGIMLLILHYSGFIKIDNIEKKAKWKLAGLSFLYPIGFFIFQILGIQVIPTSEASIIYALIPIFTLLASSVILKEKTMFRQRIGLVLSVAGILYIALQSLGHLSTNYQGYFFIFCSLLSIVFYFIYLKKVLHRISTITATYYLLLYAALIVNITNIGIHIEARSIISYIERFGSVDYIYVVLYLGILSTLGTSFLTNYSLKHLPVSLVGVFNNLSPIIGLFAGVIILHETLHSYYIYGCIWRYPCPDWHCNEYNN